MAKYKKPKVGFLEHVDGKQNKKETIDEVLKEASSNPTPEPKPKAPQKKRIIKEDQKPSAPGMSSYVEATKVDPNSAKGSFDESAVEGYVRPVFEESKPQVNASKMTAYQKAVQERELQRKKTPANVQEAADLLGGDPSRPVTQNDLKQIKVALASLGGGGLGEKDVIHLINEFGGGGVTDQLDSDQIQEILDAISPLGNTDSLPEGLSNLYYTDERVDSNFALKTTDDLTEGSTNLYYTDSRSRSAIQSIDSALIYDNVTGNLAINSNHPDFDHYNKEDFDSDFSLTTTDSLAEGVVNLYYTDSRARASIQSIDSSLIYDSTTGNLSLAIDPDDFYTTVDFDSDFLTKTTDSLAEGDTNLYYTTARHDSDTLVQVDSDYVNARVDHIETTDSLPEGLVNLYYTDSRARSAIQSIDSALIYDSTTGDLSLDFDPEDFYTTVDFDSDFLTKTTDSLTEGLVNLYYTTARHDSDTLVQVDSDYVNARVDKIQNTDSLPEGINNLYWTQARFDSAFDSTGIRALHDSLSLRVDSDDIEIQTLKNRVDDLDLQTAIVLNFDKQLAYDSATDSLDVGNYAIHFTGGGTDYLSVDKLFFNHIDKNGNTSPMAIIDSGDIILLQDSDGGVARYIVSAYDDRSNHHEFDVTVEVASGAPADQISVKAYPEQNLGDLATYNYVDAQDKLLQNQIDDLDSALDSEHAWNVAEHAKFSSGSDSNLDSEHAWNVSEHKALDSNLSADINDLSDKIDSDHSWAVDKFDSLDGEFVNVSGDTMTGDLVISNPKQLKTNKINSVGNSNLSIQRNSDTKIQLTSSYNRIFQKSKYNSDYGVDSDLEIPHKKYVDDAILVEHNLGASADDSLQSQIDSNHDWTIEEIDKINSVDYLPLTGGTLSGQLKMAGGQILLSSTGRNINVEFGTAGRLQYSGGTRFQWGNEYSTVFGTLNISDGQNYLGDSLQGMINMHSNFIKNLPEPTVNHHAATKRYVDTEILNAAFEFDSSQFVDATGDSMTGELSISRSSEHNVALRIKKDDQNRLYLRSDGLIHWTGDATDPRLNSSGRDISISVDDVTYMKFDQSQGDIEVAKTLTLTAPDKQINLPNNADTGELASNSNRRLYWDKDNVGVDVPLLLPDEPKTNMEAANKEYVDNVAGSFSGAPLGSITMHMAATAPSGYFILDGSNFDMATYPLLHQYLTDHVPSYVAGTLPDYRGYFPGAYGADGLTEMGKKYSWQTGKPSSAGTNNNGGHSHTATSSTSSSTKSLDTTSNGGHSHTTSMWRNKDNKSQNGGSIENLMSSSYNGGQSFTRSTNTASAHKHTVDLSKGSYSTDTTIANAGSHQHALTGFDSLTRPNTFATNFIIRHD